MKQPTFRNPPDPCSHTNRGAQLRRRRPLSPRPRTVIDDLYSMAPAHWSFSVWVHHSPALDRMVLDVVMEEAVMGWRHTFTALKASEAVMTAQATIDRYMRLTLPDQGNGVPKPSKCPDTQGGDTMHPNDDRVWR